MVLFRKGLVLLGVLAAVIVWALVRTSGRPMVPASGLRQAEVTVATAVTRSASIDASSAVSVAAAINALPTSPRSGSAGCGMDQGYTDTVVFEGTDVTTAVIDLGGCLTVTVSSGDQQWVLDDSSGAAVAAVNRAVRTASK